MKYLLCLETSTTNCSVALSKENQMIAIKEVSDKGYSHAEKLHIFIDEILKENKVSAKDIVAIVISKGPGSYTGLRIGVSAAKGLCYAWGIPLIAVNTLESLAHQIKVTNNNLIVPMLDARRMEVYTSIINENYETVSATEALILDENSYTEHLEKQTCYFIGDGTHKFQEICTHRNAKFVTDKQPSAKELCVIGWEKFTNNETENVAYFEPYYLKDFVVQGKKKAN